MKNNLKPENEKERLAALKEYNILDTIKEEEFDRLTQLASLICEVPIALVSLIDEDRQWFKSRVGLDAEQTPRDISFCQHAIMTDDLFEVEDATKDDRFKNNPLVTGAPDIKFYAGFPLKDPNGLNLGTLCTIDRVPKKLDKNKSLALKLLAEEVVSQIVSRKNNLENKKLERLFSMSLDMICIAGTDGFFKRINQAFTNTLGWTEQELLGSPFFDYIHPEDIESTQLEVQKLAAGEKSLNFNNRYKKKDGEYLIINWVANPDEITGELFCIARDITETTKNEEQLKMLSLVAEKTDNAVIITNKYQEIEWVNAGYEKITGYKLDECKGCKPGHMLQGADTNPETIKAIKLALDNKENFSGVILNYHKSGFPYWLQLSITPILDENGEVERFIAIESDISERIEQENELKKINKQLDQFAYVVSHDLKAPLRGITTITEFLEEDLKDKLDESTREDFALLRQRVARMQNLITDILEYSKIGRQKVEKSKFETKKLIKEIINDLAAPENFKITIGNSFPKINAELVFISQIFSNLISNSIKYNDKAAAAIDITCYTEGEYLAFSFKDNGIGIDPQYHEKVFEVFQTIDFKDDIDSTGIGLSTVKKIADEIGAKIKLESQLGEGANFIVHLPLNVIVK